MNIRTLLTCLTCIVATYGCSSSNDTAPPPPITPPTGSSQPIVGLAECTPQTDQAVICGTVMATDGVTPLIGAEIQLFTPSSNKPIVSKGVADAAQCITDSNGEYACLVPVGITGSQQFMISSNGFASSTHTAMLITGNTVVIPTATLTANNSTTWVVVPGAFDGVQVLLAQLKGCTLSNADGLPFTSLDVHTEARASVDCTNKGLLVLDDTDADSPFYVETFLASQTLSGYDALFINCGANEFFTDPATINSNIQQFVTAGKSVYFSDLTDTWLTELYPDNINFLGDVTGIGTLIGNVVHPGLAGALDSSNINIVFDLDNWTAIDNVFEHVTTFITADIESITSYSGTHPITVGWKNTSNSGCIFYTSYHIEGASSGAPQELAMKYLIQNLQQVCL